MQDSPADESFTTVFRFMDRVAVAAVTHAREALSAGQREPLRKLVAGELDDAGRRALVPLLVIIDDGGFKPAFVADP